MKIVAILIGCFFVVAAQGQKKRVPDPVGYINDFARLLTLREKNSLDSLVRAFEKKTTVEIALLTIDGTYAPTSQFDSLVIVTHNNWGVGKKEKDNGVLVAVCLDFRKVRIMTGYGIEKKLTDLECQRIINKDILPLYRLGKLYEGTRNGLIAIMKELQ